VQSVGKLVREVVRSARRESITFLAAAVAYYAFVSLVPLLVIAMVVATTVGGESFAETILEFLEAFLTSSAQAALRDALAAGPSTVGATALSLVALVWSGLKVFRGLDQAFSEVYGTTEVGGFVTDVRDAIVALSTIGVAVVLAATVGATVQGLAGVLGYVVGVVIVPGTLFVAFLPLYYLFPDVEMPLLEAVPGAATAAIGWWILASAFGVYASLVGSSSVYGVLGAVLLLSTWLYFGAILIVLGAVVNAAVAGRRSGSGGTATEDRQVQHPGPPQQ